MRRVAAQRVVAAVRARGSRRHGARAPIGLGSLLDGPTRQHSSKVQATRLARAQQTIGCAAEAAATGSRRTGCARVGVGTRSAEVALHHGCDFVCHRRVCRGLGA